MVHYRTAQWLLCGVILFTLLPCVQFNVIYTGHAPAVYNGNARLSLPHTFYKLNPPKHARPSSCFGVITNPLTALNVNQYYTSIYACTFLYSSSCRIPQTQNCAYLFTALCEHVYINTSLISALPESDSNTKHANAMAISFQSTRTHTSLNTS